MGKFINPFTDVGFKLIFGREISKDLLIDFLNSLLNGERTIKELTFINKERMPGYKKGRTSIYDIYCTDEEGNEFIVEMQNASQACFKDRAVYYLSCALAEQEEAGVKWKFDIKAVYGVFFMNFAFSDTPHKLRTDVVLVDRDLQTEFSDKIRMIFIQLPEFNKEENECKTDFERWIYILKHMDTLQRLPFQAQSAVFKKLESIASMASLSKSERKKYDSAIKAYRDYHNQMDFAKEQALKEGIEKGFEKGKVEGITEERLKNARVLKSLHVSYDIIKQTTGLSLQEIEKL